MGQSDLAGSRYAMVSWRWLAWAPPGFCHEEKHVRSDLCRWRPKGTSKSYRALCRFNLKAPPRVTWFGPRLPFRFRLPTYRDDAGNQSNYKMIGGSLASFEGKTAAYVAYRMRNELISLVVISADQVVASGGEATTAKSIAFHSTQKDDLDVITWSVHHLTYALGV